MEHSANNDSNTIGRRSKPEIYPKTFDRGVKEIEEAWRRRCNTLIWIITVGVFFLAPSLFVVIVVIFFEPASWAITIVQFGYNAYGAIFSGGIIVGVIFLVFVGINDVIARDRIGRIRSRIDELRSDLGSDFEVRLVDINLKYLDQYYLETRIQANKSFYAAMFVSLSGFIIMCASVLMFLRGATSGAALTLAAGATTEFISALFFYMFNKTLLSMAPYH